MSPDVATLLAEIRQSEMCNPHLRHIAITLKSNESLRVEESSIFFMLGLPQSFFVQGSAGFYDSSQNSVFNSHEFRGTLQLKNKGTITQTVEFLVLSELNEEIEPIQRLD